MIRRTAFLVIVWLSAATVAGQRAPTLTFDADRPGTLPEGFTLAAMRQDDPGAWFVRRDGPNGSLGHRADPAANGLTLALTPDAPLRDVVASVRLRLAGGARAGGLAWRYLDAANYHAALLDLAKHELVLFRVTAGNRVFIESKDDLELDVDAWHTLKIVHDEDDIDVSLGGIRVFEERDRRGDRRAGPGRTGVIAAGNAEVWFDDLRIEPHRNRW